MKASLRTIFIGAVLSAVSLSTTSAFGGPMGFAESYMSMGDFSTNWREAFVNYALTSKDAIGTEAVYMRSDNKLTTLHATGLTYTRLAKRWNMPEAQANVWLIGGLSTATGSEFSSTKTLVSPGVQVDYETTRVYVALQARAYRTTGGITGSGAGSTANINHDYISGRAGFSFFNVDYDEVQPWFIVEARRMKGLSDKTEITPMLRLIHNRYFVEAGVSTEKQARLNFMFIF
jgi:hypothetical protein